MVGARRGKIERGNWGTPWKPFDVEEYRKGVQMSEQPFMDRCLVLEARVRELEAALLNAVEALERSYDAVDWPADGTSRQEIAAKAARSVLVDAAPRSAEKPTITIEMSGSGGWGNDPLAPPTGEG